MAIDRPDICQKFILGHRQVLVDHGFEYFVTNEETWMNDPNTMVVVCTSPKMRKIFGGVRFEQKDRNKFLPMEKVIYPLDIKIRKLALEDKASGTGELCGLWNAKEVAGMNTTILMVMYATAILERMKISSIFVFTAEYTRRIPIYLGFEKITSIGDKGFFRYPTDRFKASVWKYKLGDFKREARSYECIRISSLIHSPQQIAIEKDIYQHVKVDYECKFKT